jgi:hypothetical protein
MGPSEKSFNQVRSILGKLDRNIDQLRTQRTTPEGHKPEPASTQAVPTGLPARQIPGQKAGAQPATPAQPPRPPSVYGRATPIPPSGQ